MQKNYPLLSICIPTYNRASKLLRLLKNIDAELGSGIALGDIEVLVSDNCSSDDTEQTVSGLAPANFEPKYVRQLENLGFDGNIKFLYDNAKGKYVWFFSDDDIILPGAINEVFAALKSSKPDMLLFSFRQPPDSPIKVFEAKSPFEIINDPVMIVKLVARYPKVSIYIIRKIQFGKEQRDELASFLGNGYYFIDLAYSVLANVREPKLCIIPSQLAACDADYLKDVFDPGVVLEQYKVLEHPFVLKYAPKFPKKQKNIAYRGFLQFLFAYKSGTLTACNPRSYEDAIKTVGFKASLIAHPKAFLQFIFLKTGGSGYYRQIRPFISRARRFFGCAL